MTRVALKGLLGRKLRTALTAFAVVLGVAMVSGAFILTDTMLEGVRRVFSTSYDKHRRRRQRQALVDVDQGTRLVSRLAAAAGPCAARVARGGRARSRPHRQTRTRRS